MAPKPTEPSSGATLASITEATHAALRTGVPQPVRNAAGQTVFYVDSSGAVVPDAIAQDQLSHAGQKAGTFQSSKQSGNNPTIGQTPQQAQQSVAEKAAQQQQARASGALANLKAEQVGGPVWVNGQMQTVTGFHSDGTPIFGYLGSRTGKSPDTVIDPVTGQPLAQGTQSAFDALHLGASFGVLAGIQDSDRFVMAQGPTNVMSGMPASSAPSAYGPGDHSYSANVVSQGTTQMTIAQGVQWLVSLANQSPDAYNKLVTELKHAGYTGAQGEPLTGGAYSETVGVAFAKAAKDLSVQQQTTGSTMGLDDFLSRRTDAVRQAAEQATPKVQRAYADPASLMTTARTAAESALGRTLNADELARFQQSFHGKEDTYYNQVDAYNQAKAGAGAIGDNAGTAGFSATQPDASGQAASLVQSPEYGQERANYSAGNYYQAIAQMFGIK